MAKAIAKTSRAIEACQVCGSKNLNSIIFLGYVPPVNTMPSVQQVIQEESAYPLELLRCQDCTLVQIGCLVDPEVLFPLEYPYLSGTTRILREDFANLAQESSEMLNLKTNDLVMDIGSNDGTLLSNFKQKGFRVLGIEPSLSAQIANQNGIPTLMEFFNKTLAEKVKNEYGSAQVITAANVFAHIGGIHDIVEGINALLAEKGVFISESHYLLSLVQTLQYDTIYHEHLRYYSLRTLSALLSAHGLEVFYAKKIPTHGGSIRVYAARQGQYPVSVAVADLLVEEDRAGLTDGSIFRQFRERIIKSKTDLISLLGSLRTKGASIYGIGAPSRSSTLINYTGIDDGLVACVLEVKNSQKVGKYIPGTKIPVMDEAKLFSDQPDYALLLSWHITRELAPKLKEKGYKGKFIVPLPEPAILELAK